MLTLILAILTNVVIVIIFKMFTKYDITNGIAITVNYFVCFLMSCLLSGSFYLSAETCKTPWFSSAILIAFLFIATFNLIALSVQKAGISLTAVFQKLSLLYPVILALVLFGESLHAFKIVGIILAIVSIVFMTRGQENKAEVSNKKVLILPILVWILSGFNEMGLLYVQKTGLVENANIQFVGTLFLMAGFIGMLFSIFLKSKHLIKDILAGIVLGVPNFFSIYLILELLSQGWDGSVIFPILNVSILVMAGLIAYFIFSESLTKQRIFGFVIGIIALLLIST